MLPVPAQNHREKETAVREAREGPTDAPEGRAAGPLSGTDRAETPLAVSGALLLALRF